MRYLSVQTRLGERLQFSLRTKAQALHVLDFASAVEALQAIANESGQSLSCQPPSTCIPTTLSELLLAGDEWWAYGLQVERLCLALLDEASLHACQLPGEPLPILPRPPSLRDFYAFERHVKRARERRGLQMVPEWYDAPVFYFSNPCSLLADGAPIKRPTATHKLDFELEAAVIVRRQVQDVAPEEALDCLAGLTIMNDWSARDLQAHEVKVGLGPAKGKDFATSLGPVLVTWDELQERISDPHDGHGARLDVPMRAYLNGRLVTDGNLNELYYTIGDLLARASADVALYPGEVIGTGTVGGGCLLEWGEQTYDWLQPGDEVMLELADIGRLHNVVV